MCRQLHVQMAQQYDVAITLSLSRFFSLSISPSLCCLTMGNKHAALRRQAAVAVAAAVTDTTASDTDTFPRL